MLAAMVLEGHKRNGVRAGPLCENLLVAARNVVNRTMLRAETVIRVRDIANQVENGQAFF